MYLHDMVYRAAVQAYPSGNETAAVSASISSFNSWA
jgi:hypothetical protein